MALPVSAASNMSAMNLVKLVLDVWDRWVWEDWLKYFSMMVSHWSSGCGNSVRFWKSWIMPSWETAKMALAISWASFSSQNRP